MACARKIGYLGQRGLSTMFMTNTFFLSSHDYISSPEPRTCHVLAHLPGASGRDYIRVEIDPPIPAGVLWKTCPVTELYLLLANPDQTIERKESQVPIVYIFVAKESSQPGGAFDELRLAKVGTGTIHFNMEQALEDSPIGD
jgi:hypothetical protein